METEAGKVLFFLSAMFYLWENGFHFMSRPFKTKEGELFVADGKSLYFLTSWIEGKYIDFSGEDQLEAAVNLLVEMHRKGEGFHPPENCIPRNDIGKWPDKWQKRIRDLKIMAVLSQEEKDDFDKTFHGIVNICLDEAHQSLKLIQSAGYEDYCQDLINLKPLCHRDFVYHNIIVNDTNSTNVHHGYYGHNAYLIDFEYCVQDSRVIDLARLIRTVFIEHPWEIGTAQRIIRGYQKIYPLTLTEEKLLLALLLFPHDIWRTGHKWYFAQQRKKSTYQLLCRHCQFYHKKYHLLKKLEQGLLSL